MMSDIAGERRTLAAYPQRRGLAFVVLGEGRELRTYGRKWIIREKRHRTVAALIDLLGRFQPGQVVLEDAADPDLRRTRGTCRLLAELDRATRGFGLVPQLVTRAQQLHAFRGRDCANKDERATLIAQLYPVLQRRLPPRREIWMAESESMGVFDAMSLALAHVGLPEGPVEDELTRFQQLLQ